MKMPKNGVKRLELTLELHFVQELAQGVGQKTRTCVNRFFAYLR